MSRDDDGEYNEHDEEEQEAQEIGAAPVLLHAAPDGSLQLTVPARRPVVLLLGVKGQAPPYAVRAASHIICRA